MRCRTERGWEECCDDDEYCCKAVSRGPNKGGQMRCSRQPLGPCILVKADKDTDTESCDFYDNYEAKAECGSAGYLTGYGKKYCNRFFRTSGLFDQEGKDWIKCVRKCLIGRMVPWYKSNCKTCTEIKSDAFDIHPDCYTECGFCRIVLSADNVQGLWETFDLMDIFQRQSIEQIVSVIGTCGGEALGAAKEWAKEKLEEARAAKPSCWWFDKPEGAEYDDHCITNNPVTQWLWRKLQGCDDCACMCGGKGESVHTGVQMASTWCEQGYSCHCG